MSWDAQRYAEGLEAGRKESAAEIERLTKELSHHVHTDEDIKAQNNHITKLEAENERLQAEVGELTKGPEWEHVYQDTIGELRAEIERLTDENQKWFDAAVQALGDISTGPLHELVVATKRAAMLGRHRK
jgi:phage host-nuclease inhibitor protein Gam